MELTDEQKARLFDALHHDEVDNWSGYQEKNYQETMAEIEEEQKYEENLAKIDPLIEIILESITHDYPAGREAGAGYSIEDPRNIINWLSRNCDFKN